MLRGLITGGCVLEEGIPAKGLNVPSAARPIPADTLSHPRFSQ